MKKKIKLSVIFIILFLALCNSKALATFEIDKYQINCEVTQEGNLKVQENITYDTNEYRNGVIRNIKTKNNLN